MAGNGPMRAEAVGVRNDEFGRGQQRAAVKIMIHPRPWYEDGGSGSKSPPWRSAARSPTKSRQPASFSIRSSKQAAYWAAKALLKEIAKPTVATLLNIFELAYWGYKAAPYIKAYLDPPKSLEELQRAVSNPARGYDIHHNVEKKAAE